MRRREYKVAFADDSSDEGVLIAAFTPSGAAEIFMYQAHIGEPIRREMTKVRVTDADNLTVVFNVYKEEAVTFAAEEWE